MAREYDSTVSGEPIGGTVGPASCPSPQVGHMGPDDYDVIDSQGRDIGRIVKESGCVWAWAITGAVVMPHLPSHGNCVTREEAKAKFAETWRACWAMRRHSRPQKSHRA
jgi:hypothetical protein